MCECSASLKNTSFRIQPHSVQKKVIHLSEPYPLRVFTLLALLVGITDPPRRAAKQANQTVLGAGCSEASSGRFELSLPYIRLFCVLKTPFS